MMMYRRYPSGSEVFLWCEGCADPLEDRLAEGRKSGNDSVVNKRQARDEEIDTIFRQLQETHDDTYSVPQLRLWARMVISGTHDDLDNPPQVPMIIGAPLPKRPKQDKQESMTTAITTAVTAFANAISPQPSYNATLSSSTSMGISPIKSADVRMKLLEHLRYLQQLLEDGILTLEEFMEQK